MEHEKKYRPNDLLTAAQVAEVWAENSGLAAYDSVNVARTARLRGIAPCGKDGSKNLYKYRDVRGVIISASNSGPVRSPRPTPGALRKRKHDEKRRSSGAGA